MKSPRRGSARRYDRLKLVYTELLHVTIPMNKARGGKMAQASSSVQ